MSDLVQVALNSKLTRQIVIYTNELKEPEQSYPLPPRSVRVVTLNAEQLSYVRANYSRDVIIGEISPVVAASNKGVTLNG